MNHPLLNIGIRAARSAGDIIVRYVDRIDTLQISEKGANDFVSQVDREAEQAVIYQIHRAYPDHGILAEESGSHGTNDEYQWIIDPLDGTTNFLHGFPQFAVSIALKHRGQLEHGVVFDPLRQEFFVATRGAGARLNDRRIRVANRRSLDGALIGTGFPFGEMKQLDRYLATLGTIIQKTAGIRRAGSAALDLAYVAAGRLDGFWEFGLKPWDIAAGALLIKEAGGYVYDLAGGDSFLEKGDVIAGPPHVADELVKTIGPLL